MTGSMEISATQAAARFAAAAAGSAGAGGNEGASANAANAGASAGRGCLLLDVREPEELTICRIAGAAHIPMNDIPRRLNELDRERETIVFCHHGRRSLSVTDFLRKQGFSNVKSMAGGIDAWSLTVDPRVPRY